MTKIPKFEKFDEAIIPMGFGQTGISNFMLGGSTPETGYSMDAIAGPVMEASNQIASEACSYHENDNPDHTANEYLKEAKKYLNEAIDKAHESYSATNEAMVQVAGKDKPSGAKVLATVISDYLIDKNYISAINGRNPKGSREKKQLISEIQELIINSTF
jgi:hypothetical protein